MTNMNTNYSSVQRRGGVVEGKKSINTTHLYISICSTNIQSFISFSDRISLNTSIMTQQLKKKKKKKVNINIHLL